ncbi:MAG TPA: multidrug ABC transporter ATP-binding protein [Armatimonadetes bacterium]|jgi:ABC-2 type transport system ATP-binding protein|nr:multidrug ABC transporter ATP-binding protein [Armatimonadota bacterium]
MIEVSGLTKRYGQLMAVDNISFSIEKGDAFGFIGPNGAGKTTTIRMLATLLRPDAGTATINGYDIRYDHDQVRAAVGYMPDFFGVYEGMKAWEYLDFFASAYRVPAAKRPGLIRDVLELTDLTQKRDAYVEGLSRGMKQRLCLAKTIVHDPEVLLLDEPASGLDPRARIEIRELLKELCNMGKTILISSHILPELAPLCNKIGIIEQGKLIMVGSVDEISAQLEGGRQFRIKLRGRLEQAREFLLRRPDIAEVDIDDGALDALYRGEPDQEHQLLAALVREGFEVSSFSEQETDLESLYMRLTRGVVS